MPATNPLQQLAERGQSVWLDYISRELVTGPELGRLIAESNVTGLTSNPTIFEKAIAEGTHYDEQIHELLGQGVDDPQEVFLSLAIQDIRHACDTLRPVHDRTGGADGFVSLELPPPLSHDTAGSVATALTYWERVNRPNLMVKVPATPEGVPAVEELIAAGVNVNVTLIFALDAYENVITAYIRGLQRRLDAQQSLDVHSVASFFVSRVDTMVDGLLDARLKSGTGDPTLIEPLLGRAAIANARLAYATFERHFRGDAFRRLREAGGHLQRPLWASTSAKNPKYRDVIYAEALIGPDTVDTMPPATVEAFRDHGVVAGDTVREDPEGARRVVEALGSVGVSVEKVTQDLLVAGVASFAASYDQLIARIAEKLAAMRAGMGRRTRLHLSLGGPSIADVIAETGRAGVAERIWDRDPDLWKAGDAAHAAVIGNRLGWLDVPVAMRQRSSELTAFAAEVRDAGFTDAVLLGMGGSSLCPEVLRTSFGSAPGFPVLHVLDTTDPVAITGLEGRLELDHTLFLVASKSGTTLETSSHLAHFWEAVTAAGVADPGGSFVAITDPGTPLAELATERHFRRLFENPGDIGGRYSALSLFGLVPAAVMGIDVGTLLDRALAMRASCGASTAPSRNPGLELGSALSLAHAAGHDKVTILTPPRLGAFSLWAEQLIAESTGKEGKGYIPIGEEPIGKPGVYGEDRLFVALCLGSEPCHVDSQVDTLIAARLPVVVLELGDPYDLGAEFFRWEFATAVAAVSLQIDPFDEPNVKESKDNTQSVLSAYEQSGSLPEEAQAAGSQGVSVYGGNPAGSAEDALIAHLAQVRPGDYVAIMAYVDPSDAHEEALDELRIAIRDRYRVATTVGFGPRFLHSTGQLHKGGPNTGVFIQVTTTEDVDAPIPGRPFTFAILEQAQAAGDLQSLRSHGRRVIRLRIDGPLGGALERLAHSVRQAPVGSTA
ncbi:MAG: bifunctional transaldolase/phosoglucose isomerase [Candidatus Dormibacteria bacterium]|jgi:transaldolase/glucose-6-phosphate isomerase